MKMRRVLGTDIPESVEEATLPSCYDGVSELDAYKLWLASTGRVSIAMIDDLERRLQRLRKQIAELKGVEASQISQWP
jgi:hypothetical protein